MKEQGESTGDLGVPTWKRYDGASRGPLVVVQLTLTVELAEHLQDHCYTPGVGIPTWRRGLDDVILSHCLGSNHSKLH